MSDTKDMSIEKYATILEQENERLRERMNAAVNRLMSGFPPTESREQAAKILRDALQEND